MKMRAVIVSKGNAPFEIVEREVPEPAAGQVRVKVEACGVGHSDAPVSAMALLSGRRVQGWPSGTAMDSEDALRFGALTGVRPRSETFKVEDAEQAFARVMENKVRFRAVLVPSPKAGASFGSGARRDHRVSCAPAMTKSRNARTFAGGRCREGWKT